MKYHIICFLLLLISLCSNAQIRLIDGADGSPVQAASVFIDGGKCVGVSDSNGTLPLPKGYTGTVTVQHLNYTGKEFRADTVSNNTVRLTPYTYTIPEVTAKYERPDYMVITAYQRSYMILDSVPSSFSDAVYDYYIPLRHGRIKRKMRSARNLHKFRSKRDTSAGRLTVYIDSIFTGRKHRTVNFFGIKIRFERQNHGEIYDISNNSQPTLKNLVAMSEYFDMYIRPGRKFKMVRSESFEESYVTGIKHCTKKEMKAAMKADSLEPLVVPASIPPLNAPLAEAVSRMK